MRFQVARLTAAVDTFKRKLASSEAEKEKSERDWEAKMAHVTAVHARTERQAMQIINGRIYPYPKSPFFRADN